MPEGTRVAKIKDALMGKGYPIGSAIAIAQHQTGLSYATGKPPKSKSKAKKRKTR
jgi:hypothetical protein